MRRIHQGRSARSALDQSWKADQGWPLLRPDKETGELKTAGKPKTTKRDNAEKQKNSKIMHLLASLHAPSQNQARHHIWEKPRRQTMEKRYKTTTSSIYQAASAVHYHHGEHCRKRRGKKQWASCREERKTRINQPRDPRPVEDARMNIMQRRNIVKSNWIQEIRKT